MWLTRLPPPIDCQNISRLATDAERLYCAREAAQSGDVSKVLAGLDLVGDWSTDHPLYTEAHELLETWSHTILQLAYEKFDRSDLQGAMDLANRIPANSSVYAEAQTAIASWKSEWQTGESVYAAAQDALKQRNWDEASSQIFELASLSNDYWRVQKVNELTQLVIQEKEAHQVLRQAQDLAKKDKPEQLAEAIALVRQIDPKRYIWAEAKLNLETWSQSLVATGLELWQSGKWEAAMAIAQTVPIDLIDNPLGKDLIQIGQAYQLASQSQSAWEPSVGQIWHLMEAIAAAQQIQSASPFYAAAQADIQNWQTQIQDLQQLQFANLTASLGQRFTFQLAQAQAQQIASDRPRRLQAQTLAAHWGQQIQRIEDRPYIAQARDLAQSGTIPDLQQAILVASQVPLGRALRQEAQDAIAQWQDQIETIEDKPLLDEAQQLAEDGNLRAAIRVASRIESGRALYDQARGAIRIWRNKIQEIEIAEDRPILDAAYALAARERYTLAIEQASQIGEGRALYGEASGAIATWRIQRAELRARWAAEAESEQESYESDYSEDPYSDDSYTEESY
jgi:uncharacterized protein (UPF0548 family)